MQTCPSFEGCDAPLCPLDKDNGNCIWYGDEPICNGRKFKQPFIRTQRRISKVANYNNGYFTVQMLNSVSRVAKGIKGINPEFGASAEIWAGRRAKTQGFDVLIGSKALS